MISSCTIATNGEQAHTWTNGVILGACIDFDSVYLVLNSGCMHYIMYTLRI